MSSLLLTFLFGCLFSPFLFLFVLLFLNQLLSFVVYVKVDRRPILAAIYRHKLGKFVRVDTGHGVQLTEEVILRLCLDQREGLNDGSR